MSSIKAGLGKMVKSKAWLELPKHELLEIVEDPALKVNKLTKQILKEDAMEIKLLVI